MGIMVNAMKGIWEKRQVGSTVSRSFCGVVIFATLSLASLTMVGCVEIVSIDANLMFEAVSCVGDGGPPVPEFEADTHVVELFELTGPVEAPTDCNNCVLTGSGCEPPRRLCRCGPIEESQPMTVEAPHIAGLRFEDLSKDRRYCLRYIALTTESPPTSGATVDCDCPSWETARSQAVFCGSSQSFDVDEAFVGELPLMMSGGCTGSTDLDICLGNQWY